MENLSFEAALKISEERYFSNADMTPASRYKNIGLYHELVKEFLLAFDNVHLIIYDDYRKDIKSELHKAFKFLDIEKIDIDTSKRHMVGGWQWKDKKMKKIVMPKSNFKSVIKFLLPIKGLRHFIRGKLMRANTEDIPEMGVETRTSLRDHYTKDVKKLSILLNRDLNHWTI